MAIYHCTTKPISRSAGRSAVAAAAYRAGESITDERTGLTHDYTRRHGVISTLALLPTGETCNRSQLWNAAEGAEKRKDARTAREWVVALPAELNQQQRLHLATDFAQKLGQRYGVAVDLAIHLPDKEGDQRNHHAHILTTTREVKMVDGALVLGNKATLELSDKKRGELKLGKAKEEVKAIRALWAESANEHLACEGHEVRIDHRTLKEQGIDKVASVHLGPVASDMERKGKTSELGDKNREAKRLEAEIIDLKKERAKRKEETRLSPENIEKVYSDILKYAEQCVEKHYSKLKTEKEKANQDWLNHQSSKPTEIEFASKVPLVGYVMLPHQDKKYVAKLKEWEDKDKRYKNLWSETERRLEGKRHTIEQPIPAAERVFKEKHPELAKERDRLQQIENQRKRERLNKEREAKRQRSQLRGRGRGSFER